MRLVRFKGIESIVYVNPLKVTTVAPHFQLVQMDNGLMRKELSGKAVIYFYGDEDNVIVNESLDDVVCAINNAMMGE